MKNKKTYRNPLLLSLLFGLGAGVLFWCLEALVHTFIFHGESFLDEIFTADVHELWMRVIVVIIIFIATYLQLTLVRRRALEQATRELAQYRETLYSAVQAGILVVDAETHTIVDANPAAVKMIGASREEIVGEVCHKYLCPEEVGRCPITDLGRQIDHSERLLLTASGKEVPIIKTVAPLVLEGRKHLLESFVDISEHKQTEEALRKSESKYRTLTENLPQNIFLKDKDLVYISCNENYARDLKIKPEEIAGRTDYEFYPRELAEKYRSDDKRIMEAGETEELEEEYEKNGQRFWVHTVKTPVKDGQGNIIGILGIFWDITEHKRSEEEVARRLKQATALASAGSILLMTTDVREGFTKVLSKMGQALDANAMFILHWRDETLDVDAEWHQPHASESIAAITNLSEEHVQYLGEQIDAHGYLALPAEGEPEEDLTNMLAEAGINRLLLVPTDVFMERYGYVGVAFCSSDDSRALEERNLLSVLSHMISVSVERNISTSRLEEQKDYLVTFTGQATHDLKKPLTAIKTSIAMLASGKLGELEDKQKEALDLAADAAAYMETLTQELLDVARMDAGRLELHLEEVVLDDIADQVLGMLKSLIDEKDIEIIRKPLPNITADPAMLEKILMNLIGNALSYLSPDRQGQVKLGALDNETITVIYVKDNGIGIPEDQKKKIFERFVRGKHTANIQGTGLGLAIVKGMVEAHGGKIWLDSTVGKGTTFYFTVAPGQ